MCVGFVLMFFPVMHFLRLCGRGNNQIQLIGCSPVFRNQLNRFDSAPLQMQAIKNPLVLAIPVVGSFEKHSPAICMVNFSQKEIHRPKHQFSGANLLLVFREGICIYIYICIYLYLRQLPPTKNDQLKCVRSNLG